MLYYIFKYLDHKYAIPGAGLFEFISFRAALAIIFSLFISLIYGKRIILLLKNKQIGEEVRELGLEGQVEKKGTPTMGGIIIILATVIPVLFFAKIENIYIILLLITIIWMGIIGFIDDYIKVFNKNKKGLKGKFKILGQMGLGVIVGATLYFHPSVTIKENALSTSKLFSIERKMQEVKSTKTTIPFVKDNEFDYADIISFFGEGYEGYAWLIFIPVVIFIITAVSNATNLTDGIDGLAAGSSTIVVVTLGVFAWVSGNIIFSDYLNIMYIPRVGEVAVFLSAFAGGLIGFLWFNSFPAQVFMGDTGSLTIGSVLAVIAIVIRKELMIPIFCGVFLAEALSVIVQVSYFKYTKNRLGVGKRIFLMSPIHHHFQKLGVHESKITSRFLIIGILLAVIAVVTLKIR